MSELAPILAGPSIVLLGSFNPAIFHPEWFARHGLLREDEGKADLDVVSPPVASFSLDWLKVQVTGDRFIATAEDVGHSLPLRDLVIGTFTYLEHTPIRGVGLNRLMHFKTR